MEDYEDLESYIYDEVLRGFTPLLNEAKDRIKDADADVKNKIWDYILQDVIEKINERRG